MFRFLQLLFGRKLTWNERVQTKDFAHNQFAPLKKRAALLSSGWVRVYLGEPEVAIKHVAQAMRLSPSDLLIGGMQCAIACAHFLAGRYDEASSWAERAIQEQPNYLGALRVTAASNALAGRLAKAQQAIAHLCQLDPQFRVSNLVDRVPLRRPEDLARYAEGLRKAGLPE
jgi:tetratricopeptide (TPR) repeat protein